MSWIPRPGHRSLVQKSLCIRGDFRDFHIPPRRQKCQRHSNMLRRPPSRRSQTAMGDLRCHQNITWVFVSLRLMPPATGGGCRSGKRDMSRSPSIFLEVFGTIEPKTSAMSACTHHRQLPIEAIGLTTFALIPTVPQQLSGTASPSRGRVESQLAARVLIIPKDAKQLKRGRCSARAMPIFGVAFLDRKSVV